MNHTNQVRFLRAVQDSSSTGIKPISH